MILPLRPYGADAASKRCTASLKIELFDCKADIVNVLPGVYRLKDNKVLLDNSFSEFVTKLHPSITGRVPLKSASLGITKFSSVSSNSLIKSSSISSSSFNFSFSSCCEIVFLSSVALNIISLRSYSLVILPFSISSFVNKRFCAKSASDACSTMISYGSKPFVTPAFFNSSLILSTSSFVRGYPSNT